MPSMMASKNLHLNCQTAWQKPNQSTQRNVQKTTSSFQRRGGNDAAALHYASCKFNEKSANNKKETTNNRFRFLVFFLIPGLRLLLWPVALSGHAVSANTIIAHCRRKTNLSKHAAIHPFQISYEAAIESHLRMRISNIEFLSDIVATVAFYACGSKLFVCSNVAQLCPRSLYYTRNGIKVYLATKIIRAH